MEQRKQTAVEWLKSELQRQFMFEGFAWEDRNYLMKLLDQAYVIEIEYKKQAINNALLNNGIIPNEYLSEEARDTFQKLEDNLYNSIIKNRKQYGK